VRNPYLISLVIGLVVWLAVFSPASAVARRSAVRAAQVSFYFRPAVLFVLEAFMDCASRYRWVRAGAVGRAGIVGRVRRLVCSCRDFGYSDARHDSANIAGSSRARIDRSRRISSTRPNRSALSSDASTCADHSCPLGFDLDEPGNGQAGLPVGRCHPTVHGAQRAHTSSRRLAADCRGMACAGASVGAGPAVVGELVCSPMPGLGSWSTRRSSW
jgi:hypothetical protein